MVPQTTQSRLGRINPDPKAARLQLGVMLGYRLGQFRLLREISPAKMAAKIGYTEREIEHVEAGIGLLSAADLILWAQALEIDVHVLLEGIARPANILPPELLDITDLEMTLFAQIRALPPANQTQLSTHLTLKGVSN